MCFFKDTATTEIYALSLHDALPIAARSARARPAARGGRRVRQRQVLAAARRVGARRRDHARAAAARPARRPRSEEHTSELQSRQYLVCRLLLEKTNNPFRRHSNLPP